MTSVPGVCISTLGPGATNLSTGVGAAWLDRTPLIAITCNVPTSWLERRIQMRIDHHALFQPLTKASLPLREGHVAESLSKALVLACAEPPWICTSRPAGGCGHGYSHRDTSPARSCQHLLAGHLSRGDQGGGGGFSQEQAVEVINYEEWVGGIPLIHVSTEVADVSPQLNVLLNAGGNTDGAINALAQLQTVPNEWTPRQWQTHSERLEQNLRPPNPHRP